MTRWTAAATFPLLIVVASASFAQTVIRGKVVDREDGRPIAYVNIGIPGTAAGTLSNEDGSFSLPLDDEAKGDTLVFSALGYARRFLPLVSILKTDDLLVRLTGKPTTLREVVVTGRKEKAVTFALGNRYTKGGFLFADSVYAGAAIALLIDNAYPSYHEELKYPLRLEAATFFVNKNTRPGALIRIRVMAYDSATGKPGADLLEGSVIAKVPGKKGWIDVDLSPYGLVVARKFFLVTEWIMEDKDRLALLEQYAAFRKDHPQKVRRDSTVVDGKKIGFMSYLGFSPGTHLGISGIPFSLKNYTCFYRTNSLGEWNRSPVILSARVSVSRVTEPTSSGDLTDPVQLAARHCQNFGAETAVHGFQVAIARNGELVFSKGYGFADAGSGAPVTTGTRFRMGSISKPVTAAALMQLAGEQRVDLDAAAFAYIDPLPRFRHSPSVRQLAGHTGGVRHYRPGDVDDLVRRERYPTMLAALGLIKEDTLLFEPGQRYHYSSFGWNILGAVIETASRQSYVDYLSARVLRPLQLTRIAPHSDTLTDMSEGYLVTGEPFGDEDMSCKYSSGGLVGSSEDLARFGAAMLARRDDATFGGMFRPGRTADGKETSYGIGWNISRDSRGRRVWFHTGNLINGSGMLVLYPDYELVIAFLSNGPEGLLFDAAGLADAFCR